MSGGSLKDLVKALTAALSTPVPAYKDSLGIIQEYLDKHAEIDDHESQRLHEELLTLHAARVQNNPDKHAFFLACFRQLRPALIGVERLLKWWEILVKPTLDSMGQAKAVVADARAIVLSVLAYEDDDDPTGEKASASLVFTDKLFEVFLEKTKLLSGDRGAGFKEEARQRFVCANVEAVLLAFGKRRPKIFLEKIDSFVVQREYRLQVLGLLCSFVRLQGPHLYQILQTQLLDHLLQCLENDTSTTVISLALTVLIMFMPHLCNSLANYLPRLFIVYTRVLCWDKFGVVRVEEQKFAGYKDVYSRTGTPQSADSSEATGRVGTWQKLDSSFETASSTTPDVSDYFTFLYGLYPINFLDFLREPYRYLERANYKEVDILEIEEETIRHRSNLYRQRHILHPNFFTLTVDAELRDQTRWMKVEPADVTAQCIGLVNNNTPATIGFSFNPKDSDNRPNIPGSMVRTEDIPSESLLNDDNLSPLDESQARDAGKPRIPSVSSGNYAEVLGLFGRGGTGYVSRTDSPSRGGKTPDSPTIPATLTPPADQEPHLQDMLNLQEQLRASLNESVVGERGPPPPSGPPPDYPGGYTASPRLEAYVHSLNQNSFPRSPALRPASSDTQGTISYLQREVMLLRNDLNFERYLKQQHLSHIGHLQRKHINESTAEAETQNLINTNKSLKAKLEEAKKAYAASRQETLKSKNQAKKWEAELSAKIRTLREEQKAWRQDEDTTKRALQVAREETDHLRKLLAESEAEGLRCRQKLQSLNSEMEEINKLRSFVDHLSNKLNEYESRSEEFELQRHTEEAAVSQVDRMKLRLQSREHEMQKMKRNYDNKLKEMESRLNSLSNPMPSSPGPGFQGMIDSALNTANQRLAALKKAHNHLLTKYTELEIKYIELQASQEMDDIPRRHGIHTKHINPYNESHMSDTESHYSGSQVPQRTNYQHSEDSMSPHSSYTDSSGNTYSSGHPAHMQGIHSQSAPNNMPPSFMSSHNYQGYGGQDVLPPPEYPPRTQLRHRPSVPDNVGSSSGTPTATTTTTTPNTPSLTSRTDDAQSLKTVTSSTSSEKRKEKIKPQSEIRIRGRGGVQNIGKKDKEKEEKKKKSKFETLGNAFRSQS